MRRSHSGRHVSRVLAFLSILAVVQATRVNAQSDSTPQAFVDSVLSVQIRDYQARLLRHQRVLLLGMVDSMPERLYRDKATPTQRDFAQQIYHAANAPAKMLVRALGGPPLAFPDTAEALNTRAGLRSFVNAAFDYMEELFHSQSESDRARLTPAGKAQLWQLWDGIYAHTMWTGGQVVANFRKHGMAPPDWLPF